MVKHPLTHQKGRLPLLFAALFSFGLVRWPEEAARGAAAALEQCITTVIPSLFPFLVLSSLVIAGGVGGSGGLTVLIARLFGIRRQGVIPLLLGLVGGYPVGARTIGDLRRAGLCSRREGERLLAFCNNCGPAFLLSTAGTAVLGSPEAGWLLWAGHLLGAFLLGILWPGRGTPEDSPPLPSAPPRRPFSAVFTEAVVSGGKSVLKLCAFVVFFGTAVRLLTVSGVLALLAAPLEPLFPLPSLLPLLTGSLEMTQGILALSGRQPTPGTLALAAFLLGWGGLSVHCQTKAVLGDTDLGLNEYLLAKLCHGLLAALFTGVLARLLPIPGPVVTVFAPLGRSFPTLPEAGAALLWLVLAVICLLSIKKGRKIAPNGL